MSTPATVGVRIQSQSPKLRPAEVLLALAVAVGLVSVLVGALHSIPRPFQVNYEEGNILNAGVRILHGATPYAAPSGLPSALNPYGPVGYLAVAGVMKTSGIGFAFPRLLVFLSALSISGLLVMAIRSCVGDWKFALLFGFLYLALPGTQRWLYTLRFDFLAVALSLAGVAILVRYPERWLWAVPFFALALFTKPTALAAPAACLAWLLVRKRWKDAAGFSAVMALALAIAFIVVQWWADGWFWFHAFGTHPDPYLPGRLISHGFPFLVTHAVLLVLAAFYLLSNRRQHVLTLPALYFGFCCLTALTLGKLGSDTNHLLELLAAACLCAALGYREVLQERPRLATLAAIALAASCVASAVVRFSPQLDPDRVALSECNQAYAFVKGHPGKEVLSENTGAVVLGGKPVIISNPYLYGQLVLHRHWSDRDLQQMLSSQKFDLLVMSGDTNFMRAQGLELRWPPHLLPEINENYRVVQEFYCRDAAVMYERKDKGR